MTSFYTKSGDDGYTRILGEGRLPKYDLRLDAVGSVDEANSALGLARSFTENLHTKEIILQAQRDLYHLMAEVAATPENAVHFRKIDAVRVTWLEEQTDGIGRNVTVPKEFITPGDFPSAAAIDLARTVVRRAERSVAQLLHQGDVENVELLRYLNRLSSLCYILELAEFQNHVSQGPTLAKDD